MFAVGTYDEIMKHEREKMFSEVVVFLFVKPTTKEALDIIREFEYIHFNSGMSCSVYAIGYSNDFAKRNDRSYRKIEVEDLLEWFFSNKAFVEFKQELERRINWEYSGEIDILVLQNNPGHSNCLNFKNYVAVNINRGLRQKYIDSFQQFMEELIRVCTRHEEDLDFSATNNAVKISVKTVVSHALNQCISESISLKDVIADRIFYKSANNFQKKKA